MVKERDTMKAVKWSLSILLLAAVGLGAFFGVRAGPHPLAG